MPEFWPEDLDPTVLAMCGHVQYATLDAAHISNVEQPDAYANTVLGFLRA